MVEDLLGQGTFGQVVRCLREDSQEQVAVKVIKNQTAFYHQVQGHSIVQAPVMIPSQPCACLTPQQTPFTIYGHLVKSCEGQSRLAYAVSGSSKGRTLATTYPCVLCPLIELIRHSTFAMCKSSAEDA